MDWGMTWYEEETRKRVFRYSRAMLIYPATPCLSLKSTCDRCCLSGQTLDHICCTGASYPSGLVAHHVWSLFSEMSEHSFLFLTQQMWSSVYPERQHQSCVDLGTDTEWQDISTLLGSIRTLFPLSLTSTSVRVHNTTVSCRLRCKTLGNTRI
jgi:hypothetical protein